MHPDPSCPKCGRTLPTDSLGGLCPYCLLDVVGADQASDGIDPTIDSDAAHQVPGGFVPPTPDELNQLLPQLDVLGLLGCGGMGAVYKARQKSLERLVALKIIKAELANAHGFADRFEREAKALAKLNHPNIVGVHDFGKVNDVYYLIMEYVDGTDLRQLIASTELQPAQALAIVPQVCSALQFAHDQGIVHRDVKPENILVDKNGTIKVADFGLAKLLSEQHADLTATNQVMGTVKYMAPEQFEGSGRIDHRADIYSLGVVFYELLTGELPLGRFAYPSEKARVDARIDDIVMRALERKAQDRYQHASDIKEEVEQLSDAEREHAKSRTEPQVPPSPSAASSTSIATHVDVVAYINIVFGCLLTIAAVGILIFMLTLTRTADQEGKAILTMMGVGSASLLVLFGVPGIIAGWGLLQRKSWSRVLAIILAVVDLVNFPIGTLLGVYMLWVLTKAECKELMESG